VEELPIKEDDGRRERGFPNRQRKDNAVFALINCGNISGEGEKSCGRENARALKIGDLNTIQLCKESRSQKRAGEERRTCS